MIGILQELQEERTLKQSERGEALGKLSQTSQPDK